MKNISVKLQIANLVIAILFLAFTITAVYLTTTWIPPVLPGDPGAAFFPRIALGVMFIFSFLLLLRSLRFSKAKTDTADKPGKTVTIEIVGFVMTIVYSSLLVIGMAIAAFEISAFAFLAIMLGVRTGRWTWASITALISMLLMYAVFILVLRVRLPLLFLPDYIRF